MVVGGYKDGVYSKTVMCGEKGGSPSCQTCW